MERDQIRQGSIEMLGAMLISGSIGWFVLASGQPVPDVVFWRCVFGAATLLSICAALGFLRPGILSWRTLGLAMLGGVAIVANWVLLFASYSKASIAIATVVYNTQPFMLVALGALFLRERITWGQMGWLLLAFGGMLAIVQSKAGPGYVDGNYFVGLGLALAAAFLYAIAALVTKRLTGTPPHLIALIQVSLGILLLAPLANLGDPPSGLSAWGSLITMGIVHTGLMYVLLYKAIQKLPTVITGTLSFVYPIAAIAVDWVAFGHHLAWLQWLGVAAILVAAVGTEVSRSLKKQTPQEGDGREWNKARS
ncbi:DMT family transporter [Zestomonas carbonaria]|uniref:EamA domain-containing protein n=1 Tax=Zestomonas carbonaria TaxID=2762745 RepID=A0A7U7IA53_9GAMM|nr:DMT family transporter [Pseudomonas carbonaria]CAD5109000.1 hypothetical protein PSEWESI4_03296 [Pseudomonas carbonaria]